MEETNKMQAQYPQKQAIRNWDPVRKEFTVRKFPETDETSMTIGHGWIGAPEVLKNNVKDPLECIKDYYHDYNIERSLMRSQTTFDFGTKYPETKRHNKHTSCNENSYIYPPSRTLTDRPPQCRVHGTSEMRDSYKEPETPARLITGKEQYMHPATVPVDPSELEASSHKDLEPLYTTHDGFEKYLDPYLTTSRLHHRPYTADQLDKESNAPAKTIVTYYTCSDVPLTRSPKTKQEYWRLPLPSRPKTVYDRERFNEDFREIRTHRHNRPNWVPRSFRTEVRDNFSSFMTKPQYKIHNKKYEESVQSMYVKSMASLNTNTEAEYDATSQGYTTENSTVGSLKPLCRVFDPYPEKNKKLMMRENKTR